MDIKFIFIIWLNSIEYFLLKYLIKIAHVQPVIHNGRIISLTINYGKIMKYQLEFKDSYLILLNSLSRLTKNF